MLFTAFNGFGESAYTYNFKTDILIGALSIDVFISPLLIPTAPPKQDMMCNKDEVNPFDQSLMFPYHKTLDIIGDIGVYGLAVLPGLSLIGNITNLKALATYGLMYAEAFLLTFGTLEIVKIAAKRNRPYTYFDGIPAGKEDDYYKSFASRHTAVGFMSAGFLTSTFFTEYPDSPWKIPVAAVSYVLAAGISASRIASGNHFLTDVLAGAAIGSVYGYLIPRLHLRKKASALGFAPTLKGFVISYRF
jgi:undecaprenyl-diphosphatase